MSTILAKLVIGVLCAVLGAVIASSPRLHAISDRRFGALAIGLGAASRVFLFVTAFLVLGLEPMADIRPFYLPQGQQTLAGKLVYRDFPSSYAPLFPYLMAVAVGLWNSTKSIVLVAILFEALSMPLWLRAARGLLGERTARIAMVLYLCNALPLLNAAIEGQNQSYCAFFFALSAALLAANRPFLSGLAAGATLCFVKLTGVLVGAGPFIGARDARGKWLLGGALLPALTYGGFVLAGADVTMPARVESGDISSGNLRFLLTVLGIGRPTRAWNAVLLVALVGIVIWALWARVGSEPRDAIPFGALVLVAFMIASKKSYAYYLVLGFFPLAAVAAERVKGFRGMLLFGLFGALAELEPTLFFRWLNKSNTGDLALLWRPAPGVSQALVGAFALCDVALVGAYFVLGWMAHQCLREPRAGR